MNNHLNTFPLNLARKWRSKNFDELIGQDLAIRLIKNSLYKNLIFPVYLFSGTKGCGKTSTARLFAAALNCSELQNFQKNPQIILPCYLCKSCEAVKNFQHPDIIEIDAASHTGVDNIRTIIENASFVPTLGQKKIYIIDEAHMLSKAAFNALLKILEEPPISVVFMLATTDAPKILDTVRSRCFQLFFYPIMHEVQLKQLEHICKAENIAHDIEGLFAIAKESEGSMRDAINIMERVRLAFGEVSKKAVLDTIGYLDDDYINSIILAVLESSVDKVLELSSKINFERHNIILIWKKIIEVIQRALLNPALLNCSNEKLLNLFEICCAHEFVLLKSTMPLSVFQVMLIKMCRAGNVESTVSRQEGSVSTVSVTARSAQRANVAPVNAVPTNVVPTNVVPTNVVSENKILPPENNLWIQFLQELEKIDDPLVTSVFKQGIFSKIDNEKKVVEIIFSNDLIFFKDLLENSKSIWMPYIKKCFGIDMQLIINFEENIKKKSLANAFNPNIVVSNSQNVSNNNNKQTKTGQNFSINISDEKSWPTANKLVKLFPGTITDSMENYE